MAAMGFVQLVPAAEMLPPAAVAAHVPFDPNYNHPIFGSVDRGSEHIVLESFAPAPWGRKKKGHHHLLYDGYDHFGEKKAIVDHSSSSGRGGSSSSGGIWDTEFEKSKGKEKNELEKKGFKKFLKGIKDKHKKKKRKGKKPRKDGCYCKIARKDKGEDAALITLGSIGLPLAVFGSVFGSGTGALLAGLLANLIPNIPAGRESKSALVKMLTDPKQPWMKIGAGRVKRDLGSDMEFIDENEIVLRMLDDLMMTYKYGYVPKCTRSHICKLNKAAASGGQPQSTIVPLMSLPAAWLLGKPSSNVMDFLHAVWLGRNEKDCDEVYPECSDIYSSLRFRGGGANSTDTELEADLHMDELLNDLRYLEENNQMAPAAETNQDRKEDDPKEEKTT